MKKKNDNALKEYVQLIVEVASSVSSASESGLALFVTPSNQMIAYILYEPDVFLDTFKKAESTDFKDLFNELRPHVKNIFAGYIEVIPRDGKCNNATEIVASAARKSFGPLMYDIVMNDNENGIFSDRSGTSPSAQNVWKYYDSNRGDVESEPFDNKDDPKTPPPEDDCHFVRGVDLLNRSYRNKRSSSSFVTPLLDNHEEMIFNVGATRDAIEKLLHRLGISFFHEKYQGNK